jgi:hypothetical protein
MCIDSNSGIGIWISNQTLQIQNVPSNLILRMSSMLLLCKGTVVLSFKSNRILQCKEINILQDNRFEFNL